MAEFKVELKDPMDFKAVLADYWQLDDEGDWFDFYRTPAEQDHVLVVTIRASDVRSITRYEEPTPA